MLLAEPPRTQFDLNFQVLGFPVRVHPFFWLVGLVMGLGTRPSGIQMVIWIFAMFVSILIHELGHALMIRRFGRDAYIVLYAMGGLAIDGRPQSQSGSPWSLESYTGYRPRQRLPAEQILISAAGPGIQFALAGLIVAGVFATGGSVGVSLNNGMPLPFAELGRSLGHNAHLVTLVHDLLYINIFWAIMNLLPVLPLDGGQIALQFFIQRDPWQGTQRALWLSVIAGAAVAVIAIAMWKETFLFILFASLAVSSYFTIQQSGGGRRPW